MGFSKERGNQQPPALPGRGEGGADVSASATLPGLRGPVAAALAMQAAANPSPETTPWLIKAARRRALKPSEVQSEMGQPWSRVEKGHAPSLMWR
jgi:hypothetical protein